MMKRRKATFSDLEKIATRTYWQLPAGAPPALAATGQPDVGVTRALADPSVLEETWVSSRYDEIRVPTLGLPAGTTLFV